MKHTLVNIPDPNNPGSRIVGIRIDENHEAWGEMGLSEPCSWLRDLLEHAASTKTTNNKLLLDKNFMEEQ